MASQRNTFTKTTRIPCPSDELAMWHLRPGALIRLTPGFEPVKILFQEGRIDEAETKRVLETKIGPLRQKWTVIHSDYIHLRQFKDTQIEGPFREFVHTHRFLPDNEQFSLLQDQIEYRLPLSPISDWMIGKYIRNRIEKGFNYRHKITIADLETHHRYPSTPLKIAMTGATGLIGTQLSAFLTTGGHTVYRIVRRHPGPNDILWDPDKEKINPAELEGMDVVIHLAGESIGNGRWNEAKKKKIGSSRIIGTTFLANTLAQLNKKPRVFISASAIGFYGNRANEILTETQTETATGFLPEVCREWEAAAWPAVEAGIRVVHPRTGIVLTPAGGALKSMLLPYRLGLGGLMGSGRQYMSWITLDDLIYGIYHLIQTDTLSGPVNMTSPHPVQQKEFNRVLGKVLSRPAFIPVPGWVLKLILGEMAEVLLLSSARVLPGKLESSGFQFRYPDLESGLRHILGK